jgi:uncharacterized cupin superfamily protein
VPRDELCYYIAGRAEYRRDNGERVEILPETLVLFPAGWSGQCTVHERMRTTYMLTADDGHNPRGAAPLGAAILRTPLAQAALVEWGVIPSMIEGQSYTSGQLLHKGAGGHSECGIWRCTPGRWNCHVTRDEFCHFLDGRSTYVHESGEIIEITPDTVAFFPKDWKGVCTVHQTVAKVYMIR